ncbi:MAG: hypothetical protein NT018_08595, partial [Armatimonadetes bacterium]|nr:hypothetical protein [Armatimonadota bacterium]
MSVNIAPVYIKTDSAFRDQLLDLRSSKLMLTRRFRKHWRRNAKIDELSAILNNESDVRLDKPARNSCQSRRPTKCTPELTKLVCRYLNELEFVKTACALCGIDRKSFYTWLQRGEMEVQRLEAGISRLRVQISEQPYVDFYASVSVALAQAELELLYRIEKTDPEWILERRFPERWGRHAVRKHSGELLDEDFSSDMQLDDYEDTSENDF